MNHTLHLATVTDAAAVQRIYAPYVRETVISFELEPPSVEEMAGRIAKTLPSHPWLVYERDGEVLGYAYGGRHAERAAYRWACDVSIYLDRRAHRSGVGRALYTALLALLRAQGFHTAHGGITLPNAASVGLHEALGFRPVALYPAVGYKLNAWRDVGWWALPLRPPESEPAEPLPLAALFDTKDWDEALAAGRALLRD